MVQRSDDDAGEAYKDAVDRFLGKTVELRFVTPKPYGLVRFTDVCPSVDALVYVLCQRSALVFSLSVSERAYACVLG